MNEITNKVIQGDCIETMRTWPAKSINCCVTSPPYWGLRDYGVDGQLGLEDTPEEFVSKMVAVFAEVKRVLRDDGTLWLNLGDSYIASKTGSGGDHAIGLGGGRKTQMAAQKRPDKKAAGLKPKNLCGIPWRVAFALQADGWYLRQDIIWHKPNPMPESVKDRCTKSHEYIFLLTKKSKYYYDQDAIREECIESNEARPRMGQGPNTQYNQKRSDHKNMHLPSPHTLHKKRSFHNHTDDLVVGQRIGLKENHPAGKNKRSVWSVCPVAYKEAHFATFPPKLIEPCILAGCPAGGLVLDPFMGSGTTAMVAYENNRNYIGCELNPEYIKLNRADKAKEKYGLLEQG